MNKYLFILITIFIIFIQIIYPITIASAGLPVVDLHEAALGGIEEKAGPIAGFRIFIIVIYTVGLLLLGLSTRLLETVIHQQTEWLNLGGEFVSVGFAFTSGLVNTALILILIIIAFATILKVESYQAKKLLPKLIIIAILLNFSLVFMGMVIDISHIFFTTLLAGNEAFITNAMRELIGGIEGTIGGLVSILAADALLFATPVVGLARQIASVIGVGIFLLPNILTWTFQLIVMYLMSIILFIFVLLFSARVFIIQILAILSPIAFLCYVLPTTKRYWDEWLKYFLSWTIMGVNALFFLVLGLTIAHELKPNTITNNPFPGFLWIGFSELFIFYLFLIIYLMVVLSVTLKTMPAGAQAVIDGIKKIGTTALGVAGGIAMTQAFRNRAREFGHNVEKFGKKIEIDSLTHKDRKDLLGSSWYKIESKIGQAFTKSGAKTHIWTEQADKAEEDKAEAEMKKLTKAERMIFIKTGTQTEKTAALRIAAEEGEIEDVVKELGTNNKEIIEKLRPIYQSAKSKGIGLEKNIAAAIPHLYKELERNNNADDVGKEEERLKEAEEGVLKRIVAKPELISKMHSSVYDDERLSRFIIEHFGGRQIAEAVKAGEGDKIIKLFKEELNRLTHNNNGNQEKAFEEFVRKNSSAARYLASGAAQGAGIPDIIGLDEKKTNEILKGITPPELPRHRPIKEIELEIQSIERKKASFTKNQLKASNIARDQFARLETLLSVLRKELKAAEDMDIEDIQAKITSKSPTTNNTPPSSS